MFFVSCTKLLNLVFLTFNPKSTHEMEFKTLTMLNTLETNNTKTIKKKILSGSDDTLVRKKTRDSQFIKALSVSYANLI